MAEIPLPEYATFHSGRYVVVGYEREIDVFFLYLPNRQSYEIGDLEKTRRTLSWTYGLGQFAGEILNCCVNFGTSQALLKERRVFPLLKNDPTDETRYLIELMAKCEQQGVRA